MSWNSTLTKNNGLKPSCLVDSAWRGKEVSIIYAGTASGVLSVVHGIRVANILSNCLLMPFIPNCHRRVCVTCHFHVLEWDQVSRIFVHVCVGPQLKLIPAGVHDLGIFSYFKDQQIWHFCSINWYVPSVATALFSI